MTYVDSDPVIATLHLRGVWLHDPDNPEGTIKHYPYGNLSGGLGRDIEQVTSHYAGRVFPVVDYGEHQDDVMSVSVQVVRPDPYFPQSGNLRSLKDFSELRRPVMARDRGGRAVVGAIEGWRESQSGRDIHQVGFSVRQVDRAVELVGV